MAFGLVVLQFAESWRSMALSHGIHRFLEHDLFDHVVLADAQLGSLQFTRQSQFSSNQALTVPSWSGIYCFYTGCIRCRLGKNNFQRCGHWNRQKNAGHTADLLASEQGHNNQKG